MVTKIRRDVKNINIYGPINRMHHDLHNTSINYILTMYENDHYIDLSLFLSH